MEEFAELVGKLDQSELKIAETRSKMKSLIREFNANKPSSEQIEIDDQDSTGLDKQIQGILNDLLAKEQNVSYRGILEELAKKNLELEAYAEEVYDLQQRLPKSYRVTAGQTHHQLSLKWLMNEKNLSEKDAKKLLDQTMLIDELVPGFNVWFYYQEGVFGSFVTQGIAKVSPNKYKYSIRKEQLDKARESGRQSLLDSLVNETMDTLKAQGQME